MRWSPFRLIPRRFLGIDIGTSAVKLAEISRWGVRRKLENYGEVSAEVLYEKPFRTFEKSTLLFSSKDVSRTIKAIIEESKIKTRQCVFSIPDFSTFFTTFELPQMTKEELPEAVRYEARQHVPLPLAETVMDWQIIDGVAAKRDLKSKIKILLVAVPNEIVNQYREIAKLAELEMISLEAEVFSLARSLVSEDEKRAIALVDIGAQSTTCSIIKKRSLRDSHSFDIAGNSLTERIAKSLALDYKTANTFKQKYGLLAEEGVSVSSEKNIREIITPLIDLILQEVEKITANFSRAEKVDIQKIIIAGSTALLPGLKEYFQDYFKSNIEIEIGKPFLNIFYPPILENTLKEMGPSYAIAIGAALRGLE